MPLLVALKLRLWCFPYTQCSQNSLWNKFPFHQDLHTFFTHVTQSPEIHHVLSPFVHHQQPCFQAIYTSFRIPFMTTKMPLETLITPPLRKLNQAFLQFASHFQVFSQCHQTSASVSSDASSSFLILLWLLIGKAARWILLAIGRERCLPSTRRCPHSTSHTKIPWQHNLRCLQSSEKQQRKLTSLNRKSRQKRSRYMMSFDLGIHY